MNLQERFRHPGGLRVRRRACLAVFLLLAAILAGCSGKAGGPEAAASRSIADICAQAQTLVDKGHPQQAVDVIESIRKKYTSPPGTATPAPADPASHYCQQEYTNANYWVTAHLGSEAASAGFPQTLLANKELWAVPPIGWGLSLIGGWLAGTLLAALLARFKFFELKTVSAKAADRYGIAGHLLLLAGASASAIFISRAAIGRPGAVWLLYCFLATVAFGVVFLALALANRVALQLSVRNREGAIDQSKTSNLLVLIRNLGYKESYKGIPATDSQNHILANSTVEGTPENRVMAFLQFILTTVFGVHPWRVSLDETADGFLIVIINRNGRSTASERISAAELGEYAAGEDGKSAPAPGIRSYKMAAALISTTLSLSYSDFDDLCGATQWRSIGMVYAAAGEENNDIHLNLLTYAAILDPENLSVQLQLQAFINNEETSGENLLQYADWLLAFAAKVAPATTTSGNNRRPGLDQLYSLCLSNYLHAVLNLRNCEGFEDAYPKAHEEAGTLLKFHASMTPKDPNYQTILSMTEIAQAGLDPKTSPEVLETLETSKGESLHPTIRYNLACTLLVSPLAVNSPGLFEKALGHLRYAVQDPELRDWAAKDPVLARTGIPESQKKRIDEIRMPSELPAPATMSTLKRLTKFLRGFPFRPPLPRRQSAPE